MRLLPFFYTTFLTTGALASAPLWVVALAAKEKHRAGFLQKITGEGPEKNPAALSPIWYHAVSVGEVMASLPLIDGIFERFPDRPVWVSTVTATGQATAQARLPKTAGTFYFPYDLPWIIDRVIQSLRPALFITTETEIWPNCVWRLHRYGVPLVLVNGRISDRSSVWYLRFQFLFEPVLRYFNLFCMQSEESAQRIRKMGAPQERIRVTGNLKFDQDLPDASKQKDWRAQLGIRRGEPVLVAGSTHSGEEVTILRAFRELQAHRPDLKLILAPRAPERFDEVEVLISQMGFKVARRSELPISALADVIVLDTIGELSEIYSIAEVGLVGGSLIPHGGHNPLEVAAHRCPVVFGPHMENFREIATLLVQNHGAVEVSNEADLERALLKIFEEPSWREQMGKRAFDVLISNRGAVDKTLGLIEPILCGQE